MLAVIDTNVLISALLFRGQASKIHEKWVKGLLIPVISSEVLQEYTRVLAYPKFKLSESEIRYLLNSEIIPFCSMYKEALPMKQWIPEDTDDDKFINLCIGARVGTLISGDSHIIDRKDSLPVNVLTIYEFLKQR